MRAVPQPPTPSPTYRRTFVGREQELRQLQAAFDAAVSGQGSLAMVVGEPGIGKTSICEQLATYVAVRGGKALVGHCYEEGSLSLPYLPFVEAMRSYVLAREPDDLRKDLGSGAMEVARLVSEIRDRLALDPLTPHASGLAPSADPDDDRWRLLQAVTGFLRNASAVQPLAIVLEDLHDADRGTIDLLLHLARNLQGARLFIVGTYRDVEVDRAHPLSAALAELRRAGSFLRVPLRGLTVDEVHRMYCIIRGQEVPWSRAEAIHGQTEGNPLFVQEVLRYLVEEGLVVREGGRYVRLDDGSQDAGIPEGLRDVVGKRLSRLGERANQVLSVAAVIGREFRLDVLQMVASTGAASVATNRAPDGGGRTGAGLSEDEVIAALEEAQERAVIEEHGSAGGALVFRFTHAFFRQTLYEEIFAARRIRWHQQVARALEEVHARRLEEHAAELAEHFSHSSDPADLQKAVTYGELAGRRAMSVYAYAEAGRHWEQALNAQDVLDPDDTAKRCDLLLALGESMLPLEEAARIGSSVAEEAFALAESLPDSGRAARAAVLALEALLRAGWGAGTMERPADIRDWAARADLYAQPGTADRVYADIFQRFAQQDVAVPAVGHMYLRRAVEQALALDDTALVFAAAGWAFAALHPLRDRALQERLAREVQRRPHGGVRTRDLGACLAYGGMVLLQGGDRPGAEALWGECAQLADRTHDTSVIVAAISLPVHLAYLDGRLEEALALCESLAARAQELGVNTPLETSRLLFYVGRGSAQTLEAWATQTRPRQAAKARILSYLGRHEEARAIRDQFGDVGAEEDESATHILLNLFEAAILGSDADTVRALAPRLAPHADWLVSGPGLTLGGCLARHLGAAAALLGKPDEARAYYEQALEVCARVRFRPEIALTRLQLAELLLDQAVTRQQSAISNGPDERKLMADKLKAEGSEHLDVAIEEFRAMKMQPYLERALRHKGLLHA